MRKIRHLVIPVIGALCALVAPQLARAGTSCSVPGDHATIQAAVDTVGCTTIMLSNQTFTEEVLISRNLTLNGNGATLSGSDSFRPLTVDGRATGTTTVTLTNLTLSSGLASGSSISARNGGCLLIIGDGDGVADVTASNLTVSACIASDMAQSGFGGGIAVRDNATLNLSASQIIGNYANKRTSSFTGSGSGGGLYVRGTSGSAGHLLMTGTTVENNVAARLTAGGDFAIGGGLRVQEQATAVIAGNTWTGNVAREGGTDPTASAIDLVAEGGAIAVTVTISTGSLTVTGDNFVNNVADSSDSNLGSNELARGGAVSLHATNTAGQITGQLIGVTMTGNQAKAGSGTGEGRGGAIHARGATLIVERSTIVGNRADNATVATDDGYGGGIYFREPDTNPSDDYLEVASSIIAGNDSCNGVAPDCIGDGAQVFIDYSGTAQHVATLVHTTLADDSLNAKPALHFFGPTSGDELIVHNSIIANHTIGIQNTSATGWSRGLYNLFDGNTVNRQGVAFGDEATWVSGTADFVNPAGGDFHIGAGSTAIDLARNVGAGSYVYGVSSDVDGQAIIFGAQGEVDAGADERNASSIFSDGFESGLLSAWTSSVGGL